MAVRPTPRQQLLRVLDGEPLNPPPVWLLFPYHPLGCYVDVQTHSKYKRVFEASRNRAIMLNRRHLNAPIHTPDVQTAQETINEARRKGTRNVLTHGAVRLCSERTETPDGTHVKRLLTTDEDLEAFLALPIETSQDRIHQTLEKQLPQYLREKAEFPEHYGAMMLDLGEPIGRLYAAAKLEEFAIWSLTRRSLVEQWLQRMLERYLIIYTFCLERDLADVYFLVGSEMASPPLVSRSTFQQWIVPFAKALIDCVHQYGKRVIQHYHGQIQEILPDFLTMGADAVHTIEAPPIGDCTISDAFSITGNAITLIGNIQYDEFRALTPQAMKDTVRDLIARTQGNPFILSPTAGPYEDPVEDRVIENYLAFLDAADT